MAPRSRSRSRTRSRNQLAKRNRTRTLRRSRSSKRTRTYYGGKLKISMGRHRSYNTIDANGKPIFYTVD